MTSHVVWPLPFIFQTKSTTSIFISDFLSSCGLLLQIKSEQKLVFIAFHVLLGEFSDRTTSHVFPFSVCVTADGVIIQHALVNVTHNGVFFLKFFQESLMANGNKMEISAANIDQELKF